MTTAEFRDRFDRQKSPLSVKTERRQIKLSGLIGQLASASSAALQISLLASAIEVFAIVAPFLCNYWSTMFWWRAITIW